MQLEHPGWSPALDYAWSQLGRPELVPGRVSRVDRGQCRVLTADGEVDARWTAPVPVVDETHGTVCAVGDWCALESRDGTWRVVALLPRKTCFTRGRSSGASTEQVIAANIDVAFVTTGMDQDFSLRRIERYLTLVHHSGARGVVVLNKADLCDDVPARRAQVEQVALGVEVLAVSALTGEGVAALRSQVEAGVTGAFLGSSGAGKSTLINALLGEQRLPTREVRAGDDTGQHTTTRRELLVLPSGGAVIDTPGLREVGLVGDEEDLAAVFADITQLAGGCRFSDCRHEEEPGCAVAAAVARGDLEGTRLESFHRLGRELESATRRRSAHAQREHERSTVGKYRKLLREAYKLKGR